MSMYYISFSCFVFTCFDFVFLSQNLNINIFVSDYDTVKMIFTNKLFGEEAGQVPEKAECWKMLNAGLGDVCKHCPSTMLYGTIAVKENAYNRC